MSKAIDKHTNEIKAITEGLPFKRVDSPAYEDPKFEAQEVRQERTYTRTTPGMQIVSRFLAERGTVEILSSDNTVALFEEIHWCAHRLRALAEMKFKSEAKAKEHVVMARRLVSRMESAEEELFIANRRLIVACVKPFFWIGQVWLSDFLQEGSKALSNAIRKFDFTRGTPFYSYAQVSIQNRLRNFFRDHVRSGNLGIRPSEDMIKMKQVLDKWREEHTDDPPPAVLAVMTGIDEAKIIKLRPLMAQWQRMPYPPLSLDAMLGESTSSLHEIVEDTKSNEAFDSAEKAEIWSAIENLPERSRYILQLRFIEGRTLEETGERLNLTRARIKQIQDESLRKLRQMLRQGTNDSNM